MIKVYEVSHWFYDYPEDEKLFASLEKAQINFQERIDKLTKELKLVTDKDVLINKHEAKSTVEIIDEPDDIFPNKIKQAYIYYYPIQFEVDEESQWSDHVYLKIEERDLL